MATVRRRGKSWQVQVRRKGCAPSTRSFTSSEAAKVWAREQERSADLGELASHLGELKNLSVSELLERYQREVSSQKRGKAQEAFQIAALRRTWLAQSAVADVRPVSIASFRDQRLEAVSSATVRRELAVLSHCFEVARREWGVRVSNPVREVRLPKPSAGRERRLSLLEMNSLEAALANSRAVYLQPLVQFAIETGMRRGELLSLRWGNLDLDARTATLLMTKNGNERRVPLSRQALNILSRIPRTGELLFPIKPGTVRQAWDHATRKAGTINFRFHDLRHEAISRFFELGLTVPEVALISGHKDVRMLFRYTHLKVEAVLGRMDKLQAMSDQV